MAEATWGDETKTPEIDWRMSAALEDVPRGDDDLPLGEGVVLDYDA